MLLLFVEVVSNAVMALVILTGRGLVHLLSRATWHCESMVRAPQKENVPAGAFFFTQSKQVTVTANGQLLVGVLFYLLAGFGVYWIVLFVR